MKKRLLPTVRLTILIATLMPAVTAATPDLVVQGFEDDDYGLWQAEGSAFGTGPCKGTLPGQMEVTGFEGKGLVNSFRGGDGATGKLTSPALTIERDFINFLIGGGGFPGKTCMVLMVEGKVVLEATGANTEPGGSEALNWRHWDVRKFKGKQGVIRIIDEASGGWGHINVDHIVQSDQPAKERPAAAAAGQAPALPVITLELEIRGGYLLLPLSNHGRRGRMTVDVGGQLVHSLDCDFAQRKDAVDWWGWLDVSEHVGKTARISAKAPREIVAMIESGKDLGRLRGLYDEPLRPQFHFSQMRGWNNDPNGMCYHDGVYHLFWQSNPAGRNWGNMYWGHATSPDLVHWREQAHALRPYGGSAAKRHPAMAVRECFSGSANVDANNTGGWQKGPHTTMVAAFTDTGCGESIAYSVDRGKSWTNYEGNPVIQHVGRDPKLMWYAPGKHWVIAVYDERAPYGQNISIYTSNDLKRWNYESSVPGFYECAELIELPVDGDRTNKKWVLFAADAKYAIGRFDGKKFTPDRPGKQQVHWGAYYASQCFSNAPDGRVVQIGWARIEMAGMPFNQGFTVPTELTLRATSEGIRMFATPVKELEQLRAAGAVVVSNKELTAAAPVVEVAADNQHYDIVARVNPGTASQLILRFGGDAVSYDCGGGKLDGMPLKPVNGVVEIRVLVDRPMFEVIGGGGACVKTSARREPGKALGKVTLGAIGGAATVESLKVHEMRSAWRRE